MRMESFLGGYGSDGSGDDTDAEDAPAPAAKPPKAPTVPAETPSSAGGTGKRKVVDISKLPVKRPVVFDQVKEAAGEESAPLKAAAEAENLRMSAGRSLLAALPAPKVTLGSEDSLNCSGSRIDLSEVKASRAKQAGSASLPFHVEGSIMRGDSAPEIEETPVPEGALNHPMFRNDAKPADAGMTAREAEEIREMKKEGMKFVSIKADEMTDPDWYMKNQMSGGLGDASGPGKKVSAEVSMYEASTWKKTTHADPSRVQKRKHQINWLAHEAMEKEAELLDRAASSRLTKAQTSMKYGW